MSILQVIGRFFEGEKNVQSNSLKTQPSGRAKSSSLHRAKKNSNGQGSIANEPLVIELKECRVSIARREGIKPYMVFTDRQLNAIIETKPINPRELSWIEGFDEEKAFKYGKEITNIFRYM